MISASTLPTANCAVKRVKYSATSSAAGSLEAMGAHCAYPTMYEWKSKGVCWRTCRFVQVNGKWNVFSPSAPACCICSAPAKVSEGLLASLAQEVCCSGEEWHAQVEVDVEEVPATKQPPQRERL